MSYVAVATELMCSVCIVLRVCMSTCPLWVNKKSQLWYCSWDSWQHRFKVILTQFALEIWLLFERFTKMSAIFVFQGCSRSSTLVPLESSPAVLVIISSKSVSICNRSHAIGVNSDKLTISQGGTFLWCTLWGESSHPATRNLVTRKRYDTVKNGVSISHGLLAVSGHDGQTEHYACKNYTTTVLPYYVKYWLISRLFHCHTAQNFLP